MKETLRRKAGGSRDVVASECFFPIDEYGKREVVHGRCWLAGAMPSGGNARKIGEKEAREGESIFSRVDWIDLRKIVTRRGGACASTWMNTGVFHLSMFQVEAS